LGHAVSKQDHGVAKQLISRNLVCSKIKELSNKFLSFLSGENVLQSKKHPLN